MMQLATAQTEAARDKLRRRIQRGTVAAVRAAGGTPGGAPLWLLALEVLTSAGAPLQPLVDELVTMCLGRAAGPLRVWSASDVVIWRRSFLSTGPSLTLNPM